MHGIYDDTNLIIAKDTYKCFFIILIFEDLIGKKLKSSKKKKEMC